MSAPILILTSSIKPGATNGVFIGRVNELSGIVAQGSSPEEVYQDLVKITGSVIDYKKEEARALLVKQASGPLPEPKRSARILYEILEPVMA